MRRLGGWLAWGLTVLALVVMRNPEAVLLAGLLILGALACSVLAS